MNHDTQKKRGVQTDLSSVDEECHHRDKSVWTPLLCHCVKTVGLSCVCQLFGFLYRNVNMGADVVLADKIVEVCPLKNGMDFRIDT